MAQMVEQLPNLTQFFDTLMPVPEQVIGVPKILPDEVPTRTPVRDTQLAEQLVEFPTIVSYSCATSGAGRVSAPAWRPYRFRSACDGAAP